MIGFLDCRRLAEPRNRSGSRSGKLYHRRRIEAIISRLEHDMRMAYILIKSDLLEVDGVRPFRIIKDVVARHVKSA